MGKLAVVGQRLDESLWELPLEIPVPTNQNQNESLSEEPQQLSYQERLELCDDMHDKLMRGEISEEDFDAFIAEHLPEILVSN